MPTFVDLFKEHAVAPFFVFQIFCVGLWCLDEYWYYSLFTLVMLVVFEATVVFQRLKTIGEFRAMNQKPFTVYVKREKKWIQIESDELLPGDLVSISKLRWYDLMGYKWLIMITVNSTYKGRFRCSMWSRYCWRFMHCQRSYAFRWINTFVEGIVAIGGHFESSLILTDGW